jgi:hypothetical protein
MKKLLLSLFSMTCIIISSNAQTVWATYQDIDTSTGNDPYVIASGDLDGDTDIDLAIGTYNFSSDAVK